jgi:co-chaperonin GroES (HSP10)
MEKTMTQMTASKDRVIVKLIKETEEEKKKREEKDLQAGKILLAGKEVEERYLEAKVISVGTEWEDNFYENDVVLVDRYAGHHIKVDNSEYIIYRGEEILAEIQD